MSKTTGWQSPFSRADKRQKQAHLHQELLVMVPNLTSAPPHGVRTRTKIKELRLSRKQRNRHAVERNLLSYIECSNSKSPTATLKRTEAGCGA
jgi:hypothetical protein